MSTLTLPAPTQAGHDDDIDHYYCCDEDVAMCGIDLTGVPEGRSGDLCPLCVHVWSEGLGCPVKGCGS